MQGEILFGVTFNFPNRNVIHLINFRKFVIQYKFRGIERDKRFVVSNLHYPESSLIKGAHFQLN